MAVENLEQHLEDESLVRVMIHSSNEVTHFFVPVSLMITRELEMRLAAQQFQIGGDRWTDSLLFREWKMLEEANSSPHLRGHVQQNGEVVVELRPEEDCAATNHSHSLYWRHWLTTCIRAYYNTGTIRVPDACIGSDILLALEYFGIVYTPDQLVFDSFGGYLRVKLWSDYYTHRSQLAQWVVRKLLRAHAKHSHTFVTSPDPKEGDVLWNMKRIEVLDGNLSLDPSKYEGTPSCAVVHDFFQDDDDSDINESKYQESLDGLMRDDFRAYLQNSLQGTEVEFQLRKVSLRGKPIQRALLHINFLRRSSPAVGPSDEERSATATSVASRNNVNRVGMPSNSTSVGKSPLRRVASLGSRFKNQQKRLTTGMKDGTTAATAAANNNTTNTTKSLPYQPSRQRSGTTTPAYTPSGQSVPEHSPSRLRKMKAVQSARSDHVYQDLDVDELGVNKTIRESPTPSNVPSDELAAAAITSMAAYRGVPLPTPPNDFAIDSGAPMRLIQCRDNDAVSVLTGDIRDEDSIARSMWEKQHTLSEPIPPEDLAQRFQSLLAVTESVSERAKFTTPVDALSVTKQSVSQEEALADLVSSRDELSNGGVPKEAKPNPTTKTSVSKPKPKPQRESQPPPQKTKSTTPVEQPKNAETTNDGIPKKAEQQRQSATPSTELATDDGSDSYDASMLNENSLLASSIGSLPRYSTRKPAEKAAQALKEKLGGVNTEKQTSKSTQPSRIAPPENLPTGCFADLFPFGALCLPQSPTSYGPHAATTRTAPSQAKDGTTEEDKGASSAQAAFISNVGQLLPSIDFSKGTNEPAIERTETLDEMAAQWMKEAMTMNTISKYIYDDPVPRDDQDEYTRLVRQVSPEKTRQKSQSKPTSTSTRSPKNNNNDDDDGPQNILQQCNAELPSSQDLIETCTAEEEEERQPPSPLMSHRHHQIPDRLPRSRLRPANSQSTRSSSIESDPPGGSDTTERIANIRRPKPIVIQKLVPVKEEKPRKVLAKPVREQKRRGIKGLFRRRKFEV